MSSAPADEAVHEEVPKKKGPGLMTLVKAVAFVSVIVVLEVAAATMFIPTVEETRAIGEQLVNGEHADEHAKEHGDKSHDEHSADASHAGAHGEDHGESHGDGHGADTREVNLGSYHVVSFNPTTQTSLSIDFELFGIVLAAEEEDFTHLFEVHEKRLKEQVTIAIRGMEASDFTDPGLGLIKRIILEKTNRALGKAVIREAVFSEFSFIER